MSTRWMEAMEGLVVTGLPLAQVELLIHGTSIRGLSKVSPCSLGIGIQLSDANSVEGQQISRSIAIWESKNVSKFTRQKEILLNDSIHRISKSMADSHPNISHDSRNGPAIIACNVRQWSLAGSE